MKSLISTTIIIFIFLKNSIAQEISLEMYKTKYINEEFDKKCNNFKLVTNNDNYFYLDKGDYLIHKKNKISEYKILAQNSDLSDFIIQTSIKILPSDNKRASVGVIFKSQPKKMDAITFEINQNKEYRIKQLIKNKYQILSGEKRKEGWIKTNLITNDKYNLIEIRSENNINDIYINRKYLTTFYVPEFRNGKCGIIVSPATKCRISHFFINIKENQSFDFKVKETNSQKKIRTKYSDNNNIINNNKKLNLFNMEDVKKTFYSVQFGVFLKKINKEAIKHFNDAWYEVNKNGSYIYYSEKFKSIIEAKKHTKKLISKGYNNTFIVTIKE